MERIKINKEAKTEHEPKVEQKQQEQNMLIDLANGNKLNKYE